MKNKIFKTLDEQIDILCSKGLVINDIDKLLYARNSYQGIKYEKKR